MLVGASAPAPAEVGDKEETEKQGVTGGLWSWLVRFANNEELGALTLVTRTFRLAVVSHVSPLELYMRKVCCSAMRIGLYNMPPTSSILIGQIDRHEFSAALALAGKFGLDTDLVYERQWQETGRKELAAVERYVCAEQFVCCWSPTLTRTVLCRAAGPDSR